MGAFFTSILLPIQSGLNKGAMSITLCPSGDTFFTRKQARIARRNNAEAIGSCDRESLGKEPVAVSYTHLTLPTKA